MTIPLPYGYSILPGPGTPPPNGYSQGYGANGLYYQYPTPGIDNGPLNSANASNPNPTTNGWFQNFWTNNPAPDNPYVTGLYNLGKGIFDFKTGQSPAYNAAASTAQAAGNFFGFVSDIPRLGTFLLALIIVAGGIFLLSKGPLLEVSAGAIRKAATS